MSVFVWLMTVLDLPRYFCTNGQDLSDNMVVNGSDLGNDKYCYNNVHNLTLTNNNTYPGLKKCPHPGTNSGSSVNHSSTNNTKCTQTAFCANL